VAREEVVERPPIDDGLLVVSTYGGGPELVPTEMVVGRSPMEDVMLVVPTYTGGPELVPTEMVVGRSPMEDRLPADDVGAPAEEALEEVGCVLEDGALTLLKDVVE
jgi:hypothetical protein